MAIHDGHRERLREKILKVGIDGLQSHEILEYILFAFIPRKDTNEIAHELINTFGSLSDVMNVDPDRLVKVKGMTRNAAIFIHSLPEIFQRYSVDIDKARENLSGRGIAREFMKNHLFGQGVEHLLVVALDAKDNLIRMEKLASGTGNSVFVPIREILDIALRTGACSIIIGHNHPSGNLSPSQNDINLTVELAQTLSKIDVKLYDHFIFSDNKYYSFEENSTY